MHYLRIDPKKRELVCQHCGPIKMSWARLRKRKCLRIGPGVKRKQIALTRWHGRGKRARQEPGGLRSQVQEAEPEEQEEYTTSMPSKKVEKSEVIDACVNCTAAVRSPTGGAGLASLPRGIVCKRRLAGKQQPHSKHRKLAFSVETAEEVRNTPGRPHKLTGGLCVACEFSVCTESLT